MLVPSVALVHAASAFAAVGAADVVFLRIPLPGWTVALVVWLAPLGLPVALAPGAGWFLRPTPAPRSGRVGRGGLPSNLHGWGGP
ncbi:MAG TPA: hypothetical protein VGB42_09085 [Candidatus Thermoplasmatota archaeon]